MKLAAHLLKRSKTEQISLWPPQRTLVILPNLLCALLLFIPSDAWAAKIKVKLFDQDKKPLSKPRAKLVEKSGKEIPATKINKSEAEFDKIDPGEYQLWAEADGHVLNKSDWMTLGDKDSSLSLVVVSTELYKKKESEANELLTQGKYGDAIQAYQQMLEWSPQEPVVWSNLAKAYAGSNNADKAHEAAQKAASLDPKQFGDLEKQLKGWISWEQGRRALEAKDFPKAVQFITDALAADSSNAEAYYALALAYGHQRKYPEALKNIDQALKLKPGDSSYLEVKRILNHNAEVSSK